MYYVYRQWSFLRRADNEVVEGGYLGGSETPSVAQAEMQIVEYVKRRIEEKDDVVAYVRNKWEDVSDPYYQALTERVTAELSPRNMSKAAYRTTSKSKEPSLADKFKQAQQERLKKAKW